MTVERHLDWDSCYNARDLGGLPRRNGGQTRWGAVVRSDNPDRFSEETWAKVHDYGIRTRIDLRGEHEMLDGVEPKGITRLTIPLDDRSDEEFWNKYGENGDFTSCTPLYYTPFLDRFPHQIAKVCTAIAHAEPGGVLLHCAAGRDRTGLISLVLLALADVEPEAIVADHALSTERLKPAWAELNLDDQTAAIEKVIARSGTTARDSLLATLERLNARDYLTKAGMSSADVELLEDRLV
ncbi:tyrosine-protein phosphatase [Actinocrispum sp. NPDC049592]|uniref:tyrosine-protein phosphatase n=1 Tax=Actinocrispum sp. NPDC049592 TaxID=3154835 RepID=UPI0034182457